MSIDERPLVTFALFAYNQEKYIREAIEGAFSQTYSPLEIIMSDDCSPDGTFAIMEEMASGYTGLHKILLNRNKTNLGIGEHVNQVINISNGELIVMAAGDDISVASRTEVIVNSWNENNNPPGISSSFILVDKENIAIKGDNQLYASNNIRYPKTAEDRAAAFATGEIPTPFGCACAWSKKCYKTFGIIPSNVINEDNVLGFRAAILGGVVYISDPLVRYRIHDSNIWTSINEKNALTANERLNKELSLSRMHGRRHAQYNAHINDCEVAIKNGIMNSKSCENLLKILDDHMKSHALRAVWWNHNTSIRIFLFGKILLDKNARSSCIFPDEIKWRGNRLLPLRFWKYLACTISKMQILFSKHR